MLVRLAEPLLFVQDVWRKLLGKLGPAAADAADAAADNAPDSKMPVPENSVPSAPPSNVFPTSAATSGVTSTTTTNTTTMAPTMTNGISVAASTSMSKKRCWRRRTVHFTVFLAVFSTILSLLWIYTLTAELRRKAFDVNMTRDYVLGDISMDNPELVNYIRDIQLKASSRQDPLNATQTPEEQFIANQLQGKRDGVYFEYLSRAGAASTTAWLELELGWHGLMVLTESRSFFDARKSSRNPKTRLLQACLSTDKETKEITYHQEVDVQVTKLGEGPNSLSLTKESLPPTRLKCFPLYSVLLAYNTTTLDVLSLDSTEVQDGLVLDTIPWDMISVSVLLIHWNGHHTDAETTSIINKLQSHNYKLAKSLPTGKLVFLYNRGLKVYTAALSRTRR